MRFSQTWRAYKKSQSRWRSWSQIPSQSPPPWEAHGGYPPGMPSGSVAASAAKRRLASSDRSSSLRYQVASIRSCRESPPPRSQLSILSGGNGRVSSSAAAKLAG
ncbi:hypothetical protein ACJRO7_029726 [Eucalyptus globulus]|uniref:Uncharacterized protein n=1 Tax=Eucalyptus globulus TaxID=34317 RepID=A0ABD3JK47_EUCGL